MARTHTATVAIVAALLVLAPTGAATLAAASTANAPGSTPATTLDSPALDVAPIDPEPTSVHPTDADQRHLGQRGTVHRNVDQRNVDQTDSDAADAEPPGDEPVLLVHGFADTGYTPWWEEMTDNLADAGYEHGEVFVLNLGAVPGSTVDSPEDYAAHVCDAIQTVHERTDSDEVDVVAHSMGGLDARYCIEKLDGASDVDDLVTLGTPHQGTYVAYLAYITPGGRDMVPGSDFLQDLNDGQLAASVEYTAVWSDWDELINHDEYAKLPTEERASVPNAKNVFVNNKFHAQLVWDDDVFDAWIDRLD
ncbi:esterase/lipase family protein [Halorubellus litoreus]|uniref:Esterase/lipase family protein n=1 Tax=Halorubellus litoreus TaxID=755308 RepID=A0ABD5V7R6_9EURY